MLKQKFSKVWYVVGVLLLANFAAFLALSEAKPRDYIKLYFFDVGQGDGIYLRTVEGNDVLIDSGPGDVILSKLGKVMPFYDRQIEFAVLTHPHADHISGMVQVLKRYKVKTILMPDAPYDSSVYQELLAEINHDKTQVVRPKAGERIYLDSATILDIYYPIVGGEAQAPDINDVSIVGKLSFGHMHVLLTGDAGRDIERLLLSLNFPLPSEILKVGHHGSRHSSSEEFLKRASSTFAVISVGRNSYGHPHEEILKSIEGSGMKLLRTDERGDVVFKVYPDKILLSK